MAGVDIGQGLAALSGFLIAITGIWALFGKSRDSTVTHLVGERNRLDARVAELEKAREEDRQAREEDRARLDKVESELEALRLDHKTLLDFLRDICSGRFDPDWVKGRAQDLLDRFGGGKT